MTLMRIKRIIITLIVLVVAAFGTTDFFLNPAQKPPVQTIPPGAFVVNKIIDGDTLDVMLSNGATERVRLVGIDTPESVDPRRPIQCFGHEASAYLKQIIGKQPVRLERDSQSDDRDKYGRLLRYVFLTDGTFINEKMITDGYAYAYTRFPFIFKKEFAAAQRVARTEQRGLWAANICAGRR